jgi:hypothetical protein
MGIDRIGRGAPAAPPSPQAEPERVRGSEAPRAFEVNPGQKSSAPEVAAVTPAASSPLERLRAGQIDLDGYLDLKVTEATSHLNGLSSSEMEGLRQLLRDELVGDPGLVALVEQATGQRPGPKV